MAEIHDVIKTNNAALRKREEAAVRAIVDAYTDVEQRLVPHIDGLVKELELDPDPSVGKVFRLNRSQSLLRQVRAEMSHFATGKVGPIIDTARRDAVDMGMNHARQTTLAGMGPAPSGVSIDAVFAQLPKGAIETILGTTRSGPLYDLLLTFGDVAAERAQKTLVSGMALGYNPNKIARELRRSLGTDLTRARLIARTEINRAHRESNRASYRRNDHIVTAYIWSAACDDRTCASCFAMHGTEFDLDTPMGAHPACRCTLIPKTKTWKELGFADVPETSYSTPSGSELFTALPESDKRKVLGPRAYDAYTNGEVDLTDFVKVTHSPRWGTTYNRDSLRNARLKHAP